MDPHQCAASAPHGVIINVCLSVQFLVLVDLSFFPRSRDQIYVQG